MTTVLDRAPELRRARRTTSRRRTRVLTLLALGVLSAYAAELLVGDDAVGLPDLVRVLGGELVPGASFIVWEDTLPRASIGILVGIAFGVSGTVFQTLLRNPLASPDVIGVTSGASAGAVVGLVLFGATGAAVSAWALGGTLLVAGGIFALSRSGGVAGSRLVLVGIAIAAVLQSLVVHLLARADLYVASDAFAWLQGSLNDSTWLRARDLSLGLVVLLPVAAALARRLGVLALGDDTAAGLGVPVGRSRLWLVLTGVTLAGVATAAAGPIAFVALLSGPIARRLLGGSVSLAASGLVGALLVLSADVVAHGLVPGTSLPVGVITGALGAPFLIYLLAAANRGGTGG